MPAPKPIFRSEELEPTMALVMGRMFARVMWEQENGDALSVARECDSLWYAAKAIEKLAVATGGDRGATHFSIASSNNMRQAARVIEHLTGQRPEE